MRKEWGARGLEVVSNTGIGSEQEVLEAIEMYKTSSCEGIEK